MYRPKLIKRSIYETKHIRYIEKFKSPSIPNKKVTRTIPIHEMGNVLIIFIFLVLCKNIGKPVRDTIGTNKFTISPFG